MMQQLQEQLQKLPQEIVYEIMTFVPEYGHRVDRYLHAASAGFKGTSVYCDFYRYFARFNKYDMEVIVMAYGVVVQEDIKGDIRGYLQKNIYSLVCSYICKPKAEIRIVLEEFGLKNVEKTSFMATKYLFDDPIYRDKSYYHKVAELYAQMILYDNNFISKLQFDEYCAANDLDIVLEIILSVYSCSSKIFEAVIKHFSGHLHSIKENIVTRSLNTMNIMGRYDLCITRANGNIQYLMETGILNGDK